MGRLFAIMGEKNVEDGVLPHLRKYKVRIVFAGNNIQTASCTQAHELFHKLSQTPAATGSVRAALGIALSRGTSPKLGMRPQLSFRLASTALTSRALGCDCRGSGGRRHGSMRAENRCTTIRSFLSSAPCMATQSQVPCGTHTWGPS